MAICSWREGIYSSKRYPAESKEPAGTHYNVHEVPYMRRLVAVATLTRE